MKTAGYHPDHKSNSSADAFIARQPILTVSQPGDTAEQEAEAVSKRVVQGDPMSLLNGSTTAGLMGAGSTAVETRYLSRLIHLTKAGLPAGKPAFQLCSRS